MNNFSLCPSGKGREAFDKLEHCVLISKISGVLALTGNDQQIGFAVEERKVWLKDYDLAGREKHSPDFGQGLDQSVFCRQVLEKIAGKNRVHGLRLYGIHVPTGAFHQPDAGRKPAGPLGIEFDRDLLGAGYMP